MNYDAMLASARGILETHNSRVSNENQKIDIDGFFKKLTEAGGTTEDGLAAAPWEALKGMGLPELLARQVANSVFRKEAGNSSSSRYVSDKHAHRLTPPELVELYDPRDSDSSITKRLREISKDQPFVVFNDDGTVNKKATLQLLQELRDGLPPREKYVLDGLPVEIYKVGQRVDNFAEVNPLFPNDVLRSGECININKSWASVPLATRQLVYLARKTGEIAVNSLKDAINVHADAVTDNGFKAIAAYSPKAALEFKRLSDLGTGLPPMKVRIAPRNVEVPRRNDPFGGVRQPHKSY